MLLVRTYLDKSGIHGLGVFAEEAIRKGTKIWRFVHGFDRVFSPRDFAKLPEPAQDYIERYGYQVDGEILLTVDHDHHMNHSEDANTCWRVDHIVAKRDIAKGEEITNNYKLFDRALCAAFLKAGAATPKRNGAVQKANGNGTHKANGNGAAHKSNGNGLALSQHRISTVYGNGRSGHEIRRR